MFLLVDVADTRAKPPFTRARGLSRTRAEERPYGGYRSFVERGDYDRHLRRCRRVYRERRDALVSAVEKHFPGTEVSGIAAGLHVIAALPDVYGPLERFVGG